MKLFNLLEDAALSNPGKTAVECDGIKICYRELLRRVKAFGSWLGSNSIGIKGNVAIMMENSIEFIIALFAVNYGNVAAAILYPNIGAERLKRIVKTYHIKAVLTTGRVLGYLSKVDFEDSGVLEKMICVRNEVKDLEIEEIHSINGKEDYQEENAVCIKDTALILFSSGTTNIPKGIRLSDRNIISNVKAISKYLKLDNRDKILLVKNMNHVSSITGELLVSVFNGCKLFITRKIPTESLILNLMDQKRITVFFAVPTIMNALKSYKHLDQFGLEHLRVINLYGANMPYSHIKAFSERFPWVQLIYSYGLTEASPRVTYIYKEDWMKKDKSCGKPLEGVEVFIHGSEGQILEPGCIGEVVVKGENVMQGYYREEELYSRTIKNGFLYTGDLGYLDGEGYLYITGRKDNMIVQSGRNIYPEEIESLLYEFEGVKDVLVKAEEDELLGKKLVAYIVPQDEAKTCLKEIISFCKTELEDYKIPREFLFVESLEKTSSGKMIRKPDAI